MQYLVRPNARLRAFVGACLLVASLGAQATSYLQAQGGISALIGGPSGGYNQILSPAGSVQSATGHDAVEAGAGPINPGDADQWGRAEAASSASFGELVESSSAQARGYGAYVIAGTGGASSYALDVVTVHGSGAILLTLHSELSGANALGDPTTGNASVRGQVDLSPSGYTDNSQIISLPTQAGVNAVYDLSSLGSIVAHDGDTLYVIASLNQNTSVQLLNGGLDGPALRTVGATTQAALDYWISLSPGATLSSDSGWDYRAPTSAVPEPATAAMMLFGAALLSLRRRATSAVGRGALLALLPLSFLVAPAAHADPYLLAQDYLGALVGGPTGGYNQMLSPALAPTVLNIGDSVQASQGSPYNPDWAPISAFATGSSSVGFGLISATSTAQASGYGAYVAAAEGERAGYAFDVITVHGSGPITVTLHTELFGALSIDDPQSGGVAIGANTYFGPAGFVDDNKVVYLADQYSGNALFDHLQSGTVTVADGDSFYVIATMTRNNTLQLQSGADILASRSVVGSTQGSYADWISLSDGATLSSQSGWDYRAPAATVPEPSAGLLGAAGAAVLAWLSRGRRRRR
jgi:hypothetical protein